MTGISSRPAKKHEQRAKQTESEGNKDLKSTINDIVHVPPKVPDVAPMLPLLRFRIGDLVDCKVGRDPGMKL